MNLYLIKNSEYENKRVVAENMSQALLKYKNYLEKTISCDYSYELIFSKITECKFLDIYEEEDDLIK